MRQMHSLQEMPLSIVESCLRYLQGSAAAVHFREQLQFDGSES